MATSLAGLSASVTRILYLTGFPKELKTKDIQAAFSEYETLNGGFKIKWRDDTSLLIVFQDATVAKRAYLHTLAFPPPNLTSASGTPATIKPYDGPDAQVVIQTVNSRGQHNPNNPSRSHNGRAASISVFPTARSSSGSLSNTFRNHQLNNNAHINIPEHQHANGREPSPTLPSLPSHPTLNALINSSLGDVVGNGSPPSDPAILATSLTHHDNMGPRIGDPGKRMLGAALGVRHPGLGARVLNGNGPIPQGGVDQAMREVQRAMGGLVVAE
ncbi:hypothetical protein BDN72DRAFT_784719 [Pluteus cervinus]|uniref:Uncharacterized protein n=1 Tax=Pluteus cervinus TaxID=181527 RepID=A0ACD3BJT9_9AGAR|nr:hypothetical protein BDN72DRAFT_784719 [Pluteus cervinus]